MIERLLLSLARRSWRCYQSLNFTVEEGGVRIPVASGVGLQLIGRRHDIGPKLRVIYAARRGTFVDVGANVGAVLLELIRLDRTIAYVGFEPLLRAANYVQRLIKENALPAETHQVYSVALSDKCGRSFLMSDDETDVSATTCNYLRPNSMYRHREAISISTGDILLQDVAEIAAIKIDTEGAERLVLAGLAETIERHRPALILEVMPYYHLVDGTYDRSAFGELSAAELDRLVENRKEHIRELEALVEKLGYRFFRLKGATLHSARASDTTLSDQDFIAFPADHLAGLPIAP
jgi:FkbM family methyltransferase